MVHPAAIHPLTPGSPAYTALKVGALGTVVALRFALTRRNRGEHEQDPEPVAEPPAERPRSPHPVSRKKKRRRRG